MNARIVFSFFFFNDTATTEIYTLSLHDALPISTRPRASSFRPRCVAPLAGARPRASETGRTVAEATPRLLLRPYAACSTNRTSLSPGIRYRWSPNWVHALETPAGLAEPARAEAPASQLASVRHLRAHPPWPSVAGGMLWLSRNRLVGS